MKKEKLLNLLNNWKTKHESPNTELYDYNRGYVRAMNDMINLLNRQSDSKRVPSETDINKVFGKMPEARELLNHKPKEKESLKLELEKRIISIIEQESGDLYDLGYNDVILHQAAYGAVASKIAELFFDPLFEDDCDPYDYSTDSGRYK